MKPPVPIPPRLPRSSKVCLVFIALLAVLWILSDRRLYSIQYHWQGMLPPISRGPSTEYALELSTLGATSNSGAICFSKSRYTSYDINRDDLIVRWRTHAGWESMLFNDTVVLRRSNPFANATRNVDGGFQIFGLGVITSSRQGEKGVAVTIPILYLMLLLTVPIIFAIRRRRRYFKRQRAGQCLRCGYTLGGVSVCPECGTSAAPCQQYLVEHAARTSAT